MPYRIEIDCGPDELEAVIDNLPSLIAEGRLSVDEVPVADTAEDDGVERVPVPVPVHFSGMVDVMVPVSVPENRRRILANSLATCRVVATTDNPDAPEDDACGEYAEQCNLEDETAEAEWDGCRTEGVSGQWTGPK